LYVKITKYVRNILCLVICYASLYAAYITARATALWPLEAWKIPFPPNNIENIAVEEVNIRNIA
jgi:hypothetical protein